MGNGGSVSYMGFKIKWKSANPSDQNKIEAFVQGAGFDKMKEIIEKEPTLQGFGFPDEDADLEVWFDEMTPEEGAAIAAAMEKLISE